MFKHIFLAVVFVSFSMAGVAQRDALEVTSHLSQNRFFPGYPVEDVLTVKNTSDQPVEINMIRENITVTLKTKGGALIESSKKHIDEPLPIYDANTLDVTLVPGAIYEHRILLTRWYSFVLPEGEYLIDIAIRKAEYIKSDSEDEYIPYSKQYTVQIYEEDTKAVSGFYQKTYENILKFSKILPEAHPEAEPYKWPYIRNSCMLAYSENKEAIPYQMEAIKNNLFRAIELFMLLNEFRDTCDPLIYRQLYAIFEKNSKKIPEERYPDQEVLLRWCLTRFMDCDAIRKHEKLLDEKEQINGDMYRLGTTVHPM